MRVHASQISTGIHMIDAAAERAKKVLISEPFDCGAVDYVFHFATAASPGGLRRTESRLSR
jgi:hypothetical protein